MIKTRTVLVLGAGASKPYGFPLGYELLRRVVNDLGSPNGDFMRILRPVVQPDDHYADPIFDAFRRALTLGRTPSIDMLVGHRPEFLAIGKAAIACGLIPCEPKSPVLSIDTRDWYDYLLARLADGGGPDDFQRNRLSIITFNYDRSLEYFLFTALKNRWNLQDPDCARVMQAVPIIHVYGQLGKLPELHGGEGRPYVAKLDLEGVRKSIAEMQILPEAQEDSPTLKQAQELLHAADQIVFLGFGYHPTNLERLKVKELVGRSVAGSAFGLFPGDRPAVDASFRPATIELGGLDEDVIAFLRGRPILA